LISFANAEGTYSGVYFTDQEENMTLLLVNHASYQDLYNVIKKSTTVTNILNESYFNRDDGGITSIDQLDMIPGVGPVTLYRLKQYSYKWTSDIIINPKFGTNYPQTNFLYALSGILIGFVFMFGVITSVISFRKD